MVTCLCTESGAFLKISPFPAEAGEVRRPLMLLLSTLSNSFLWSTVRTRSTDPGPRPIIDSTLLVFSSGLLQMIPDWFVTIWENEKQRSRSSYLPETCGRRPCEFHLNQKVETEVTDEPDYYVKEVCENCSQAEVC